MKCPKNPKGVGNSSFGGNKIYVSILTSVFFTIWFFFCLKENIYTFKLGREKRWHISFVTKSNYKDNIYEEKKDILSFEQEF